MDRWMGRCIDGLDGWMGVWGGGGGGGGGG